MQLRVWIAVGDARLRSRVEGLLGESDACIRTVRAGETTWEAVQHILSDIVIVDRELIPDPVLEHVGRLLSSPNAPALVVLCSGSQPDEMSALQGAGVDSVLYVGCSDDILGRALLTLIETRRDVLTKAVTARRMTPRPELSDFVSTSPVMQDFLKTVYRVTDSDAPLLITGETGVGKERLARAIHYASRRADGPFISVNCGAIPETLLESQLFGHEKGSFTGAMKAQRGCFELAHDGTLFLDEISEMPFHLQVKLLHVLQDFEVRPVGAERSVPVDVRVIAATNRCISEEVAENRFRKDLYYRLSVVSIEVPPLRERKSDIPQLAASIATGLSGRIGRRISGIDPDVLTALCRYPWPGNVRELINVLERAMLLAEGDTLTLADLPEDIAGPTPDGAGALFDVRKEAFPDAWLGRPLKDVRDELAARVEKAYLERMLELTDGRVGEAASRAGIEPRSLFNKMQRYGLRKEDYRQTGRSRAGSREG